MNDQNQLTTIPKTPRTKNVWLRFSKYLIGAFLLSYGLYWVMSQLDLADLIADYNKRSRLALMMLSIMPAKSWGWFSFLVMVLANLWGDWRSFRWKSFPKEK